MEDSPGRLQDRFQKMGATPNRRLHIAFGWRPLDAGGLEDLEAAIVKLGCRVVFIDTFSSVNGRADQMDPNEMTQIYAALQQLALRYGIAIVVVDHHRKAARNLAESDPIDDIFGSTAKASVVDCAIGLYRKHNSTDAILKLAGRDFGDAEYAVTWDAATSPGSAKKIPGQATIKPPRPPSSPANTSPRFSKSSTPSAPARLRASPPSSSSTKATCSTSLSPWSRPAFFTATPLATLPFITVNGRTIPLLGTVDPAGRIYYGPAAQTLCNGTCSGVHVIGD